MKKSLKKMIMLTLSSSLALTSVPVGIVGAEEVSGGSEVTETTPPTNEMSQESAGDDVDPGTGGGTGTDAGDPNKENPDADKEEEKSNGSNDDKKVDKADGENGKKDGGNKGPEKGEESPSTESQSSSPENTGANKDENKAQSLAASSATPVGTPSRRAITPPPTSRPRPAAPVAPVEDKPVEEKAVDLEKVLADNLNNPAYKEAFDQGQRIVTELTVKDLKDDASTGTEIAEVDTFIEKELTDKISGETVTILVYDYETEDGLKAQLLVYFENAQLAAIQVVDNAKLDGSVQVGEAGQDAFSDPAKTFEKLSTTPLPLVSYTYTVENSRDTYYFSYLTDVEGVVTYNQAYGDESFIAVISSNPLETDGNIVVDELNKVLFGIGAEESVESTEESSEEAESVESTEEAPAEEGEESAETEETPTEEGEESTETEEAPAEGGQNFLDDFKPVGEYSDDKLIDLATLETNADDVLDKLANGEAITKAQIEETLGEPTQAGEVSETSYLDYYAVQEDRILVLNAFFDKDGNVVSVKYEDRTPVLYEGFPITVDDLTTLAQSEITLADLEEKVGKPVIVEYIAETNEFRYVWTRLNDDEMKNIEAYNKIGEDKLDVYYYEAE